ncbi:MAG TPA: PQQ-dependent sugar dehydrogenase [Vicinamibacterales bacterium]|nr:PQQ-dependent sugar dehydrogenase [Vicinamibacterales bacterium]
MTRLAVATFAVFVTLTIAAVSAQQSAARGQQPPAATGGAGRGRGPATAPPPINWPSPALPDGPLVYDTALVRPIRISVTKGLNQPWSMAFLPDGRVLVTERPGRLRIVRNGALDPAPVAGVPAVAATGLGGLMDIALHPQFAQNNLVYLTYHKPAAADSTAPRPAGPGTITLARGRWDGTRLVDVRDIFTAIPTGNASRIVFGRDGMIYMSIGSGDPPLGNPNPEQAPAQDPMNLAGKVLRLKDDGTVPPDNPFVGRAGYRPEIYTLGHRNILGLTVNPDTGAVWSVEDGPNGGDEVNALAAGKNYGWPLVSFGRFYLGQSVSVQPFREALEPPEVFWVPAIATSGLTFYTGDRFPEWKNSLFVGGMRQGEVPRSGHLERLDFNDKWEELHRESMLKQLEQRIRDVRQGADGLLYVLTAENDGALLKIEPGTASTK